MGEQTGVTAMRTTYRFVGRDHAAQQATEDNVGFQLVQR